MAVYYLDTSALDKRYALETGANWILNLTDPIAGHDIYTMRLTGPEIIAAFFRKARMGDMSWDEARSARDNFNADWRMQYQIVEVSLKVAERAMSLAETYCLRGYDAVHVAGALELHELRQIIGLPPLTFVSADEEQLRVVIAEKLVVENPNQHP